MPIPNRMTKLICILFLIFGMVAQSNAQQFHFKSYSLEEGLSRSGVYYILQDNAGFLWVGTEGGGVCKFDGIKFTTYNRNSGLAAEDVRVIFEDDNNVLWFGTSQGLSYFNGKSFNTISAEDGLADNFVRSISQDHEGNIWVGTDRGISIIDPDEKGISGKLKVNFSLPHKKIRSLLAQDDIMWIGTDRGLCKYQNNEIKVITKDDGLSHDLILCMYLNKENQLYVGTQNGLNLITDSSIYSWGLIEGLIHERVRSITEDNYGHLWVGTSQGISILHGKEFIHITSENGLSNERIRCLTNDNFGNVWIGSFFGGIMRFNHQDFISYSPEEGLISNQILSINEDEKGDIIVGTYDGVSKLKIYKEELIGTKNVNLENGLINNSVRTVYKDDSGHYWYGTLSGITIIGPDGVTQIDESDGLLNTQITSIKKVQDKYWIGTENGLAIVENTDSYVDFEIKFLQAEDGLAGKEVSSIQEDIKGDVWISFTDGQISIFQNNRFINPVMPKAAKEILSMAMDSLGRIWLGTNGNGVFYGNYNKKKQELKLKNITKAENLLSSSIYSLLMLKNQVWIGHENGLELLTWKTDSTFDIKYFGPDRGFFGLQNNQNSSYLDASGNLWFGTVNGLYSIKHEEIEHFSSGTPAINYISSVKIDGKGVDWAKSDWCEGTKEYFNIPENLSLPYNQNNISFDFIGLNFVSPKQVKYRWKLAGFNDDWCAPTSKNYASYTNLEPGEYSFLLQSSDEHGVIVKESISFDFVIEKPFWHTWLFRIAALVIGFILIWSFMGYRTRQLKKKNLALEAVIADRTKEIQSQADELQQKNKEVTDSIQYSKRIQGSILPGTSRLNNLFENYFIYYAPKDIVSGDFYWVDQSLENKKHIFFAAADCTGHGVPGAMVSLIGTRALNSSVRESLLTKTNEILDTTNKIVVEAFTDMVSGEIIKDGMDIALCGLDYSDDAHIQFQFSGAQNPAWIVRPETDSNLVINGIEIEPNITLNGYKLFEIKGNKQPIGYFESAQPFENNSGQVKKGDRIYLFTDGYADQFGGPKGKKYKYKTLKELILTTQSTPVSDQKKIFESAFHDWKGDMEQVDDICLMGIEV